MALLKPDPTFLSSYKLLLAKPTKQQRIGYMVSGFITVQENNPAF